MVGQEHEELPVTASSAPDSVIGGSESVAAAILLALVAGLLLGRASKAQASGRGRFRHRLSEADDSAPRTLDLMKPEWEAPLALGEFWDASTTRFCPVCRDEYLAGTATCEDCGVDLVDEEEVPESDVEIQEGIVRVARVANSFHGQLVRQFLSANRIPCSIQRCSPWDVFGADMYVFESDALRAKKLIRHFLAEMDVSAV